MGQAQGQKRAPKFKASKYEAPKPRRVTKEQISRATYKDVNYWKNSSQTEEK